MGQTKKISSKGNIGSTDTHDKKDYIPKNIWYNKLVNGMKNIRRLKALHREKSMMVTEIMKKVNKWKLFYDKNENMWRNSGVTYPSKREINQRHDVYVA